MKESSILPHTRAQLFILIDVQSASLHIKSLLFSNIQAPDKYEGFWFLNWSTDQKKLHNVPLPICGR